LAATLKQQLITATGHLCMANWKNSKANLRRNIVLSANSVEKRQHIRYDNISATVDCRSTRSKLDMSSPGLFALLSSSLPWSVVLSYTALYPSMFTFPRANSSNDMDSSRS
jgi:hypothetical protein